ncbi:MAG TPA: hypothetical protein VM094_03055 [Gemmatimonadales bacterium]|nr:hypothetical protein [Gemmatimonadales bacterium]
MTPTIAVVAVHGVADQKPNESARAISHLLLSLRRGLDTRFTSFREFGIALPNRRVDIEETPRGPSLAARLDVRAQFLRESEGGPVSEADYRFMRELLGAYEQTGEDRVYQTVRLEGGRLADGEAAGQEQGRASVHIYEAYWADLSRVSDRLYRIVGEFYQLLLHLPFLGLQALDMRRAAPDDPDEMWWARHRTGFAACLSILTLPIPVLNVLLLALGLSVLPGKLPGPWHPYVAVGTAALLSATLAGYFVLRYRAVRSPAGWIPAALVTLVATLITAWATGCCASSGPTTERLFLQLGAVWWLASGGLMYLLFRGYDHHRPGVLRVAVAGYLVITPGFLLALWSQPNTEDGLQQAMLVTLEPTFVLLSVSWLVLALLTTWHLVRGWWARARRRSFRFGSADASALFTSRLALSLSIGIFSQVTVLLWAALLTTVAPWLVPGDTPFDPNIFESKPGATVGQFLAGILNSNGAPVFVVGVLLSILLALVAIWAMGPSVWTEIRPVRPSGGAAATARAQRYGHWLSSGFRFLRVAGELAAIGVVVGTVLAVVNWVFRLSGHPIPWSGAVATTPDGVLGRVQLFGAITGTLAGLFALGRFADSLALGFRPALDVLLDVDNYLREHPRERTPRARIAERYTTLLRHLCRWKDSSSGARGASYSAVIIVAHSQGTVITADLLRFLRCERGQNPGFEPDLDRLLSDAPREGALPVYFLTMGCPLRQLYQLRFPDLYRWVGPTAGAAGIGPKAEALGVARWVNLYRSGDYVGRSLWTSDSDANLFVPRARPNPIGGVEAETCIGAGAHTHYWDDTAPMVASELDHLIVEAIAGATAPVPPIV